MPPLEHALISPSGLSRTLVCTPSAREEEKYIGEDFSTPYSDEGTYCHASNVVKLSKLLGLGYVELEPSIWDTSENELLTDVAVSYVNDVYEKAKRKDKDTKIFIEQKLDLTKYIPDSFGTADIIIVTKGKLIVCDYKFGNIFVSSDSYQLRAYALGAYEFFKDKYQFRTVEMHIVQPKLNNFHVTRTTINKLLKWAKSELTPLSLLAYNGLGEFKPSLETCRYCKARVHCKARLEANISLVDEEKPSNSLTDKEIEALLPRISDIKKWCEEVLEYATRRSLDGKVYSGFKLVEGRSNRKFKDENEVVRIANANGITDIYKKSLLSVNEFEKYVGKAKFQELFAHLVDKPSGKPTLVVETDPRPTITNISDFKEKK